MNSTDSPTPLQQDLPVQQDRYVVGFGGSDASIREPSVAALRLLEKLITGALDDRAHALHAATDHRIIARVEATLSENPADPAAIGWLRQLSLTWSSRLRGEHARRFRRIFELIDAARPMPVQRRQPAPA